MNLTTKTNNLTNELESLEKELNAVQNKQREIISRDIKNLQSNLTETTNNLSDIFAILANQDQQFSQQDQQIETLQQQQFELSRFGEQNSKKINTLMANFTDDMNRLDRTLNSTQEKHLKLSSHVRTHGHGNKQRIDKLDQQIRSVQQKQTTLIGQNNVLDQRIVSLTNVRMNQIERQAFENFTALSSQMMITNSGRLSKISFVQEF